MTIYLEMAVNLLKFLMIICLITLKSNFTNGTAALFVVYLLPLSDIVGITIMCVSELEKSMVSIERS